MKNLPCRRSDEVIGVYHVWFVGQLAVYNCPMLNLRMRCRASERSKEWHENKNNNI